MPDFIKIRSNQNQHLMKSISIISVLFFLILKDIPAQNHRIKFTDTRFDKSAVQSNISKIIQDEQGYIWLATSNGLYQYNGLDYILYQYTPFDSNSLPANYLQTLYIDPYHNLWIGSKSGLSKFDPINHIFINYKSRLDQPNTLSHNDVRCITGDSNGLWIGTFNGLNYFDFKKQEFRIFKKVNFVSGGLRDNRILSVLLENNYTLWIGTYYGLYQYHINNNQFDVYMNDPINKNSLVSNIVTNLSFDNQGNLLIGTSVGLSVMNLKNKSIDSYLNNPKDTNTISNNNVLSIQPFSDGLFLIGTLTGGLNFFDPNNKTFSRVRKENIDLSRRFYCMYKDKEGNVWLGSDNSIMYLAHPNIKFDMEYKIENKLNLVLKQSVTSIIEDSFDNIIAGTLTGLYIFNKKDHSIKTVNNKNGLNHNRILSLFEDKNKNLLIGTNGGGLNIWNQINDKFVHYINEDKKSNLQKDWTVLSLYEDRESNIWIGTMNGLYKFTPNYDTFIHYKFEKNDSHSISNNYILCITEDRNNILWIGTYYGLNRLDKKESKFIRHFHDPNNKNSLNNNSVFTINIHETDTSQVLWLGTYGGGLNRFDTQRQLFTHYTEKEGLANNLVYEILSDQNNNLWMSTNNGLSKFNIATENFKNYDVSDGLSSNEFNNAKFKNRKGEFLFGCHKGFVIFHPDSIKDNPHIPPIVLTSFKLFNREVKLENDINFLDELVLNYDDYVFSFEYAALNYLASEKNQYAYWMEGFEKDWTYCGTRRYVSYTNLDPGNYIFHVKGSNNDGVWNETGKSLKIYITPPYYQTWWFRTLMIIFAGLVVVFIVQWQKYYKEYRKLRYISHFKIVRKIGEGGMGEVYQAKNFITGDSVALKLLHPKLTAEESNKTRFLREAKLMSDLQHPNIVKIFETGEAAGRGYISMELLEGMTLSEFIKASGYLAAPIAVEIVLATCEALSFIHKQGVIHRDIKSENVFIFQPQSKSKSRFKRLSKISQTRLTWPERVRLMDFGLAKSLELMTITQVESIIGTIAYMSPEQASGRAVDQRSDVYSLGVVLYEALTGHLPHESDNELVLLQAVMDGRDPKPMESHGVEIPELIKDIVLKMLKKYPDERYQSIDEVKTALTAVKGVDSGKQAGPVIMKPSPASLSRQSLVYLSKGDLSKAMEVSKTAIDNIKDVSGSEEAELYFNHYKVLSTAGKSDEAGQYMNKALSRIAAAGDIASAQSGDRSILIEYNTRKWKKLFQEASEQHRKGNISEARILLLDAIALIKQSILLIENAQEKSYYAEANNVSEVIQLLNQLMN